MKIGDFLYKAVQSHVSEYGVYTDLIEYMEDRVSYLVDAGADENVIIGAQGLLNLAKAFARGDLEDEE